MCWQKEPLGFWDYLGLQIYLLWVLIKIKTAHWLTCNCSAVYLASMEATGTQMLGYRKGVALLAHATSSLAR